MPAGIRRPESTARTSVSVRLERRRPVAAAPLFPRLVLHSAPMPSSTSSSLQSQPLLGKISLVTGGARGIGRAIALGLAEAGSDVALNYLSNTQGAEETREMIRAMGRRCE